MDIVNKKAIYQEVRLGKSRARRQGIQPTRVPVKSKEGENWENFPKVPPDKYRETTNKPVFFDREGVVSKPVETNNTPK